MVGLRVEILLLGPFEEKPASTSTRLSSITNSPVDAVIVAVWPVPAANHAFNASPSSALTWIPGTTYESLLSDVAPPCKLANT